jgi:hypothetical protein
LVTDWILFPIWFRRLDTKVDFSVAFVTFSVPGVASPVFLRVVCVVLDQWCRMAAGPCSFEIRENTQLQFFVSNETFVFVAPRETDPVLS